MALVLFNIEILLSFIESKYFYLLFKLLVDYLITISQLRILKFLIKTDQWQPTLNISY